MTPRELQDRLDAFAPQVLEMARPLIRQAISHDAAVQIIRSSSGMAMNYASASVGRSHAEFTARLGVALDEAVETEKWLIYIQRCGLAAPKELAGLIREGGELAAILRAAHRTAQSRYRGGDSTDASGTRPQRGPRRPPRR